MRRFVPEGGHEPLEGLYADLRLPDPADDRPYTYLGMVAGVDGAAAVDGRTARLGGEADARAFSALRRTCDAILVGAGTVRAEPYGPARPTAETRHRRRRRGLAEVPRLVVVSASLDLEPDAPLFAQEAVRPLVLTVDDADPARRARLEGLADVVAAGTGRVNLRGALRMLRADGIRWLLCEGGPRTAGGLLEAGLVDELFLTLTPLLVGGDAPRIVTAAAGGPWPVELVEARLHAGELVLRYRIGGPAGDGPPG